MVKLHQLLSAPLLLALAFPPGAVADTTDPTVQAARNFLYQHSRDLGDEVHIEMRPPAAQMPECENPRPFLPGGTQNRLGRVTVGVHCKGHARQRYLQARVTAIGNYWVTATRIAAGASISADMLTRARGDLGKLPRGAVRDRAQIVGRVASRPLNAGAVLCDYQLTAQPLVKRRQPVTVEASGRGFRVARQGQALADGALGETVRVRMPDRHILTAVVRGPGRVEITF